MNFIALIFLLAVNWSIVLLGLLLNAFIVMKNFIWWLKGEALQSIDLIITCLGSVRILLLIIYFCLSLSGNDFIPSAENSESHTYLYVVIMSVVFCSVWWGTVLGVFYCVKITTSSNQLFVRLKMNISRMVPWMLGGSMVISSISSLPVLWGTFSVDFSSMDNGISSNGRNTSLKVQYMNVIIISLAGSITPLFIFCISIYLLIVSVIKHTRNMKGNNSGSSKPQLQAHINALINMVSFLFFYLLHFITTNLLFLGMSRRDQVFVLMCCICVSSYPSLHSILLIVSHAKLRKSILSPFQAPCLPSSGISKKS